MDNGLVMSSTSSLRTNRYISSGPMDLCSCSFLRCSQSHNLLQQVVLNFPSHCLFLLQLRQWGWNTCQWRPRQKNYPSLSSLSSCPISSQSASHQSPGRTPCTPPGTNTSLPPPALREEPTSFHSNISVTGTILACLHQASKTTALQACMSLTPVFIPHFCTVALSWASDEAGLDSGTLLQTCNSLSWLWASPAGIAITLIGVGWIEVPLHWQL